MVFVRARMRAREDDALGCVGPDEVVADVVGVDLTVHLRLTNAARDELGDLRAEIEDQDLLVGHGARSRLNGFDELQDDGCTGTDACVAGA